MIKNPKSHHIKCTATGTGLCIQINLIALRAGYLPILANIFNEISIYREMKTSRLGNELLSPKRFEKARNVLLEVC